MDGQAGLVVGASASTQSLSSESRLPEKVMSNTQGITISAYTLVTLHHTCMRHFKTSIAILTQNWCGFDLSNLIDSLKDNMADLSQSQATLKFIGN
jgi:hypothetical protein